MKTLSAAQMKRMESAGAKVTTKKPMQKAAPRPAPPAKPDNRLPEALEKQASSGEAQAHAISNLANALGEGQMMMAQELRTMVLENQNKPKPTAYRFTIERNKKGLIESFVATPTEDYF